MTPKTKLIACAILALLPMPVALTGCASVSRGAADTRRLYQPPVLRLPAGQSVPTKDGIHVPQVDEVWHSDARFRDLERAYIDLLAAQANRSR